MITPIDPQWLHRFLVVKNWLVLTQKTPSLRIIWQVVGIHEDSTFRLNGHGQSVVSINCGYDGYESKGYPNGTLK